MESPQRICEGVRRVVVTEEQRYGPRWLCDNDDNNGLKCAPLIVFCYANRNFRSLELSFSGTKMTWNFRFQSEIQYTRERTDLGTDSGLGPI